MYDPKCVDLARHFLNDVDIDNVTHERVAELAQAIQEAAEAWIESQSTPEPREGQCGRCRLPFGVCAC